MRVTPQILAVLLTATTLCACAPGTRTFDPADEWVLEREFNGRPVTLFLENGRRVRADALRMDPDSSSWVDRDTGTFEVVPTADIVRIQRIETTGESVARSARQGAFSGAVAGGLLGFFVGSALGDAGAAGAGGIIVALWGGLDGAVVGAAVGLIAPRTRQYEAVRPPPVELSVHVGAGQGPIRKDLPTLGLRASDPLTLRAAP